MLVGLSTDLTDANSVFTASITMVDGAPVVEWSPKLSAVEEARRSYTVYGRAGWTRAKNDTRPPMRATGSSRSELR